MTKPTPLARKTREDTKSGARVTVPEVDGSSVEPFLVLSWNVNGVLRPKSAQAPADDRSWSAADNLDAVQAEVLRWHPGVFASQEVRGAVALDRFAADYTLIGSHAGHAEKAGFVQLYAKKAFEAKCVPMMGVPGVASVVRVRDIDVVFVAMHLENGSRGAAHRRKHLLLALRTAAAISRNVVLFGDLNIGDAELAQVRRQELLKYAVSEAPYVGFSWNPQVNRYSDEDGYAQRIPVRFDRVIFSGSVNGCSYLVGRRKQFQAGSSFYLSDHFAVLALLDVHSEHGRGDRNLQLQKQRRAALARFRDHAALVGNQCNLEAQRVGSEEAGLMRQRAADETQADVDACMKKARKAARRFLESLRAEACGKDSLFAEGLAVADVRSLPAAPCTVSVPVLRTRLPETEEGLSVGDGDSVWRHLEAVGAGFDGLVPRIGCFAFTGNTSFVGVIVQVLLRLPSMALWLSQHAAMCDLDDCFTCAVCDSRASLRSGIGAKALVLLEKPCQYGELEAFCDGNSHAAAGFLDEFLSQAHRGEHFQGRVSEWTGFPGQFVTHVDRLFGFVVGQRIACRASGVAGAVCQR